MNLARGIFVITFAELILNHTKVKVFLDISDIRTTDVIPRLSCGTIGALFETMPILQVKLSSAVLSLYCNWKQSPEDQLKKK